MGLLICQSAPVDYSWLPRGDKLISAVRSLYRSSDRAQEDTNWHSLCRKCTHNPSFGSKRFLEKVALTFRKLPSVARWCAEWNLDGSPTKCKAGLFFFFSFKRTEHLLRNVILGRCLWSRFNSPIWFISNWCHINSTHVHYGPLSRFGAGLKGTSALKVSPPCYQKNTGSVHTGAWTYTLWFSTHTLTDWATSSRNIKLINVQNSRSQNTFLPHSAFLGWHFRDKLSLWPMQTAIPSYLNFYIQHINGEWSAYLRGFSCFCQIADSNKHSSNFCQNYLPVKMMDCPPQRLKSWKIKWNAFGLGCRSIGRININVLLL